MSQVPCVVYLPRDYPSLSQTFVRNEVVGLREAGADVQVLAVRWSLTDNIPEGWGGEHEVAKRRPWVRSLRDSAYWALRHPVRYARMWRHVLAAPGGMRWTAVRLLPSYARSVERRGATACHTHFAFDHAWTTLYAAALLGVPASITVHAADIYLDTSTAVELLRRFDTVVNVCRSNEVFLEKHGLRGPSMSVVPCGVELPPSTEVAQGHTGADIVSVGRLVPKKGFHGLLRAMPAVIDKVPHAKLTIIGGGELEHDLRELAASLGINDHVTFLGAMAHPQVLEAITRARAFVLNCAVPEDGNTDAMPVVLREAMARAVPVVTTAVAGIPESVDETCGWVVNPGDDLALAAALVGPLVDESEARRRGILGRQRVAERFTVAQSAKSMLEVLSGQTGTV